jgi:putative hydrolase of HD superfamily
MRSRRYGVSAKGLDKLETIMQHNQGLNPEGFDYRFNLGYGRRHTADIPFIAQVREILDRETEARAKEAEVNVDRPET